jgi:hypothetical protein
MLPQSYLGLRHARAALPMGLLLAACGSTGNNDRVGSTGDAGSAGSASTHTSNAGTASGGNGSGASSSGGSSATGGGAGGRESGGGAAGRESGAGAAGRDQGAGGSEGSLCPGSMLDPARATTPRCTDVADCQGLFASPRCQTAPPTYQCGGVHPIHECEMDPDCGTGRVCDLGGCGYAACVDACPTKTCASSEACESGHCVSKACDAAGALPCGPGTTCKSTNGAATCQAIACDAGFACPTTWDCAPGPKADPHGCVHHACKSSTDCACGFCVAGSCEPTPGYCFSYAPPP